MLVDYSGSSSESDSEVESKKRKIEEPKARLPLPTVIRNMNKNDSENNSKSSAADGRIRSFEHERGIWATYIYIPYVPSDTVIELQKLLIAFCSEKINLKLLPVDHYHISLTRTVVLRHHWIEIFKQSIQSNLVMFKKSISSFNRLRVFHNDEKTRSFLSLCVPEEDTFKFEPMVKRIDLSLAEFKLPTYYEDPSFHVSLLWCLYSKELDSNVNELNDILNRLIAEEGDSCDLLLNVDVIQCKCGNKIFSFPLI